MPPGPLQSLMISVLAGSAMIAVGVVPLVFWTRGHRTGLAVPALGAVAWVVSVAMKVGWAVATNAAVKVALIRAAGPGAGTALMEIYVGLLTGVFEVGLVVLAARLRGATRDEAVAFGLAFGGFEVLLLGLAAVAVHAANAPFHVFVGVVERASALVFHVVASVLVLRGRTRAAVVAFVYKSAVDAFGAWGILSYGVKASPGKLLVVEAVLAACAIASVAALSSRARARTADAFV